MATTSFGFPGEQYLREQLPDYAGERQMVVIKFVLAFLFWTIVAPSFLATEKKAAGVTTGETTPPNGKNKGSDNDNDIVSNTTTTRTKSSSATRTRTTTTTTIVRASKTTKKKSAGTKTGKSTGPSRTTNSDAPAIDRTEKIIDGTTNLCCLVCCLMNLVYILFVSSPDNYYTGRTVFETPLFTRSECNVLIEMAERVAENNYETARRFLGDNDNGSGSGSGSRATGSDGERHSFVQNQMRGYLDEPGGWQKLRHELYPTTDLNVVTDGFSDADRDWLRQKLDARLAPTLERIFGIPPSAIRANDMFLIRYDGDRRASLSKHTDDGSITFSVLLSDGFEGGGTRYWNRLEANQGALGSPFAYLLPEVGMMQTFPAMIQHEGVQTTRGRRYLLIGFLAVDKIDPWKQHPTGLSWFSSWGSFNWVSTKLKEGKNAAWRAGDAGSGGFLDACYQSLVLVCDWVFPHRFAALVDSADTDAYLSALDDAYRAGSTHEHRRGSWFAAQQIDVHIDGTFARNRRAREYSEVDFGSMR